ncbi:ABC transporter substrate-binding protein [Sporolituus thermophilus]|uniref:Putative ABC transport system substrate-binding protein n=1 Tax=Sporolituus thermophilus DSM 23256 TaxID=1123285 RepID=A0A1G7P1Y3_9FIRM|nr:ABC transporter substrate-binding protein [Sporolituus thermophilus]SDF80318.1 putative ABC transport system substrate-binding protein [Sporolituus thermophilus DSM 23256]
MLQGEKKKYIYIIMAILGLVFLACFALTALFSDRTEEKPRRVAVLMSGESRRGKLLGLQQGLAELGFMEGNHIVYQIVSAGENRLRLAELAWDLVRAEPDVVVALGGLEVDAAQQAVERRYKETGRTVGVVFAGVASATSRGLYQNPQQPRYITGVENLDAELSGKRLEYFKHLVPSLKKVGVVYEPGIVPSEQGVKFAQEAAQLLGVEVVKYPVRSPYDLLALETTLLPDACDGLLLMPSFMIESGGEVLYRLSLVKKIPVFGLRVKDASTYYFASFGPHVYHQGRQAARLVAKMLKQSSAEDIPVETPDRVELVINVDIARRIGVKLTPAQLHYADQLVGKDCQ